MTQGVVEERSLQMDPKLLLDVIERQAGTLHKGFLEGAMNSNEAFANKTWVYYIQKGSEEKDIAIIRDNGFGILKKQELIDHFEIFGKPHTADENTRWKQFRMGRGQLFAYGKNVWRTNTFKMTVDIKNWGLNYKLEENLPQFDGCDITIELYDKHIGSYPYYSIENLKDEFRKQVKYMEEEIYFNDERVNTPASQLKWDYEDKNAYYLFHIGNCVSIYNLGAFTTDVSSYVAGLTGIVVSKEQLKVNFARNDIQHNCPIYKEIQEVLRVNRKKIAKNTRKNLNDYERVALIRDFRDGNQDFKDVSALKLFRTIQGKHLSFNDIKKINVNWGFASTSNRKFDRIMEMGMGVFFDEGILNELSYCGEEKRFFHWVLGLTNDFNDMYNVYFRDGTPVGYKEKRKWKKFFDLYKDSTVLSKGIRTYYNFIPDKELSKKERRILKVIQDFNCWEGRIIRLGNSDTANAWTDGSTYICINRDYLNRSYYYSSSVNRLMVTLAHEMAHSIDSSESHVHGPHFYERMVEILSSDMSPTIFNGVFNQKVRQAQRQEQKEAERKAKKKEEDRIKKKLGIS